MTTPFVRQLGYQPGVQLNPLVDQTDGVSPDNSDQVFAVVGRFTRGRIDRAFLANRGNLLSKTGAPEAIRINALNEAKLQCYEALQNGAAGVVVSRLVPEDAAKSYAAVFFSGATVTYSVSAAQPSSNYSLWVLHHDCHNDGIILSVHAEQTPVSGVAVANEFLTLRVMDSKGVLLHEFYGSLSPSALDDFGGSLYLPDVVARQTDSVEVGVYAGSSVPTASAAYGRDANGAKWATSSVLQCFSEGGTTYANTDLDAAITRLESSDLGYGYIISGGSQNTTLLAKLVDLAYRKAVHLAIDVAGALGAAASIAWVTALNVDSHYVRFNWFPAEADDPLNGGRATWGTGGLQVGLSCARNARKNSKGFAPKNWPVAGRLNPVNRTGIRPSSRPTEDERSDLAKVHINPVIFQDFNGGGRWVFSDCLTAAKTNVSFRKLQPVIEMAASIDQWVALQAREQLMSPMSVFIRDMKSFLDKLLQNAEASGWLVPSRTINGVAALPDNAAYAFEVVASSVNPADTVLIKYWTSFDGVVRQVILEQVLVK